MEHYYAVTVAEAIRSLMAGVAFGTAIFTIIFLIARRKHDNP